MDIVTVIFRLRNDSVEEKIDYLRHGHEDTSLRTSIVTSAAIIAWDCSYWEGSLEEISIFAGKVRSTNGTLTIDYSALPVDNFGPLAGMN